MKRLLPLLALLLLGACAGGNRVWRPATAHRWDFELSGEPYLVSVDDVRQIDRRVRSSAFDHTRIMKVRVANADEVWVHRGDRFGGNTEYWKRDGLKWHRDTPPTLAGGSTLLWAPIASGE